MIDLLIDTGDELVAPIDIQWQNSSRRSRPRDYARCTTAYSRYHYNRAVYINRIGSALAPETIHGEWMGFLKIPAEMISVVAKALHRLLSEPLNSKAPMTALINELIDNGHKVRAIYTTGNWCDIDTLEGSSTPEVFDALGAVVC